MVHEAVAQRYASALFEIGKHGMLKELQAVETTLNAHPALARALEAPNVPDSVKKKILLDLFAKQSAPILNLLCILVDKKREAYVPAIVHQYRRLVEESQGMSDAEIETAVPMSATIKADFKVALTEKTGRDMQLTWKVNPDLLGGYILRQGDRLLDMSLARRLHMLQTRLEGTHTWQKSV